MVKGVYKITNDRTGEVYIGQSMNIDARKASHFEELENGTHHNRGMQEDYNSGDTFSFEVLEEVYGTRSDLHEREKSYISDYNSFYAGYNQTPGGEYDQFKGRYKYGGGRKSDYHVPMRTNTYNTYNTYSNRNSTKKSYNYNSNNSDNISSASCVFGIIIVFFVYAIAVYIGESMLYQGGWVLGFFSLLITMITVIIDEFGKKDSNKKTKSNQNNEKVKKEYNFKKSIRNKITNKNKTIVGISSLIFSLVVIYFTNTEFPSFLTLPTILPTIFLIIPSDKIKSSKILSVISVIITGALSIFYLYASYPAILYYLFNPVDSKYMYVFYIMILVNLVCLINVFCSLLLYVDTKTINNKSDVNIKTKNNLQKITCSCGNIINKNQNYCTECGKEISDIKEKRSFLNKIFYYQIDDKYRLSKTNIFSFIIFLIFGLLMGFSSFGMEDYNELMFVFMFVFGGLIFSIPAFIIGRVFHYILNDGYDGEKSLKYYLLYCYDGEIRLSKNKIIPLIFFFIIGILWSVYLLNSPDSIKTWQNIILNFIIIGLISYFLTFACGIILSKVIKKFM